MHIDDLHSRPIKIESLAHGVLNFSDFLVKDIFWLQKEQTKNLLPREFVIHLIHIHLLDPKFDIQEICNWEDDELFFVAAQWLRGQRLESMLADTATLENIKDAVYSYYHGLTAETLKQLDALFESQKHFIDGLSKSILPSLSLASSNIASSMATLGNTINLSPLINNIILPQVDLTEQIAASVSGITRFSQSLTQLSTLFQQVFASTQLISNVYSSVVSSLPQLNITPDLLKTTQFFAGLPDLTELDKILKEAAEGNEGFKKAGYGFITSDYVSVSTARRFALISPKVRSAVITSQLAAETRKPEFEQKLKRLFEQSSVLSRRWPIISQAINAHRRREYNVSIPPILAQVEGTIGDALILNGLIVSQGHKLYEKINGKLKLDKNGKPIEVRGVGTLIQRSSWQTHSALQGVADLITTQLAGERNHILHGRKTNYGAAKLSVQGLLLLLVLAGEVLVFETGKA